MIKADLFGSIPLDLSSEHFDVLVKKPGLTIERIISTGQRSPASGWYEQAQDEWVLLVQGAAILCFECAPAVTLTAGEHLLIPAMTKHRVAWTDPDEKTLWVAVHFS